MAVILKYALRQPVCERAQETLMFQHNWSNDTAMYAEGDFEKRGRAM